MVEIEFGYTRVEDLRPDPRNARSHPKSQIKQIAGSIEANSFVNPILRNPSCAIIAGHGRYLAAKQLGLETVPTITISGLSEAAERRLRIADNKIAMNASWDLDLLKVELAEIEAEGLDLELTGFSIGEIDVLRIAQYDPDDDFVPAVPEQPVTQIGYTWICGPHRATCADLLDGVSLIALMAGEVADAAFLDGPYNVANVGHAGGNGRIKHREFAYASGDMSPAEFTAFLTKAFGACAAVSKNGAVHFLCMDHHHMDELLAAANSVYGKRLNLAVWRKSNAGLGSLYRSQHELVFVYRVGDAPHLNNIELGRHGRNRTNVWDYASVNSFGGSRRQDLALHPTVKNCAMVSDAIRDVTRRGEIVIDGFLGSGTTLVAAELTGRRAFGMDIDPGYIDVAVTRWMAMTGKDAILESTGQRFSDLARG